MGLFTFCPAGVVHYFMGAVVAWFGFPWVGICLEEPLFSGYSQVRWTVVLNAVLGYLAFSLVFLFLAMSWRWWKTGNPGPFALPRRRAVVLFVCLAALVVSVASGLVGYGRAQIHQGYSRNGVQLAGLPRIEDAFLWDHSTAKNRDYNVMVGSGLRANLNRYLVLVYAVEYTRSDGTRVYERPEWSLVPRFEWASEMSRVTYPHGVDSANLDRARPSQGAAPDRESTGAASGR